MDACDEIFRTTTCTTTRCRPTSRNEPEGLKGSRELLGIPPTNGSASTTGMHFFHMRDGRIAETWVHFDAVGFLTQLGLVKIGPQD